MRIALVAEHLDPALGGLEQWTWQFAHALRAAGHEAEIVAFGAASCVAEAGFRVHIVELGKSFAASADALGRAAGAGGFDVVHDMGVGNFGTLFHPHGGCGLAAREMNRLRIPAWRRMTLWKERRYREQDEMERRRMDSGMPVVCVSKMVRRHFQENYGTSGDRLPVIYNGVDLARWSPTRCAVERARWRERLGIGKKFLLLMVAHNLRLKNAETAIDVAHQLPEARLVIAGSRKPERAMLHAKKRGVDVKFLGPVEDTLPLYAAADACIHPTWYDPCSLVTLEALACGLPLITTTSNGVSELMQHGREGFVFENPQDVRGMVGSVRTMIEPAQHAGMRVAARTCAEAHSLEAQTAAFLALYGRLLNKP